MSHQFTFNYLNEKLLNFGSVSSISELHGFVSGRAAGGNALNSEQLVHEQLSFIGLELEDLNDDILSILDFIQNDTREAIVSDGLTFSPLIPEDDYSLARRTQETGAWSQGFLHGFAASKAHDKGDLSAEVADALRDLANIAQADVGDDDVSEEAEKQLVEILEYLKVVVLMIYQEFVAKTSYEQEKQTSSGNTQSLH